MEMIKMDEKENVSNLCLLEIQEMEQKRISNELHDTTVQNLTMLIHKVELCEQLVDRDIIQTKLELETMKKTLRKSIQELRNIIYNIRPMSVDDLGLTETVERFVAQKEFDDCPMEINLDIEGREPKELKPIVSVTLLRVIQELYNNAKKHAQCENFDIHILFQNNKIIIHIKDDGIGFSMDEAALDGKNFGLSIMRERVLLLSGKVEINTEKNKGTQVCIEVPVE